MVWVHSDLPARDGPELLHRRSLRAATRDGLRRWRLLLAGLLRLLRGLLGGRA